MQVGDIGPDTDWSKALNGVDTAHRNQNIGKGNQYGGNRIAGRDGGQNQGLGGRGHPSEIEKKKAFHGVKRA